MSLGDLVAFASTKSWVLVDSFDSLLLFFFFYKKNEFCTNTYYMVFSKNLAVLFRDLVKIFHIPKDHRRITQPNRTTYSSLSLG